MISYIIKNKKIILGYLVVSFIPFIISVSDIYFGRIAFWYDPARDFLLALKNLENPTFIGQPSGLPGLFYGPYWIWTISLWTLISKDPRVVSFFLLTLPYFTIFPFVLYKISKKWGVFVFLSIWFLFIFNFSSYATQIWNVHYGALFLLIAFYLLINPSEKKYKKNINYLLLGFSAGLVANFHLSIGIPLVAGLFISILIIHVIENRKNLFKNLSYLFIKPALYSLGIFFSFIPFILFEVRHNFIQLRTFLTAVVDSVIYNTATVGQTGMNDNEIISSFFSRLTSLLGISFEYITYILVFLFFAAIFTPLIKKTNLSIVDKRLIISIFVISFVMLASFISNKNPIWGYYFIGVEVIFMLFVGLFLSKLSLGKYIIIFFIIISLLNHRDGFSKTFSKNNFTISDLGTRTYTVDEIFKDAEKDFQYVAYSSAIYTYEYDYLFKWKDEKYSKNITQDSDLVYVIIPKTSKETEEDFKNYKTPKKDFNLIRSWEVPDGTHVYKMIKK